MIEILTVPDTHNLGKRAQGPQRPGPQFLRDGYCLGSLIGNLHNL